MAKRKNKPAPQKSEVQTEKSSRMESLTNAVAGLSITQNNHFSSPKLNKENVAYEFDKYFGDASKLVNWQRFCVDIGLNIDELTSLTKCKQVRNPFASFPLFSDFHVRT